MEAKLKLDILKNQRYYKTITVNVPYKIDINGGGRIFEAKAIYNACVNCLPSLRKCNKWSFHQIV